MTEQTSKFVSLISDIEMFSGLDKATRKGIARYFKIDRYNQGDKLIERGKKAQRFFLILKGNVEVQTPDLLRNKKNSVTLSDGSVLGEVALLTNTPYSSDAVALEKMSVFYIDRKDFIQLLKTHKSFAQTMTDMMTKRMALDGGMNKVGRYILTQKIGEGNMAMVFEGYDPTLDRFVALKMLKYELSHDKDFLLRFEQEAKTIAKLNHHNIVNVYETVNEYSTSFIVMERLWGKDLGQILKENGPLSVEEARKVLYQVVCGLEYAHTQGDKGIIHRDIKPENIFVDNQGHVKLTDYGVAKPPMDVVTTVIGTPKYLAPEIIKGEPFDGRADIYSLGIMAYTLLSGRPPFNANTLNELLQMQVYEAPPDIRLSCPNIDDDFKNFIEQSLIKEPENRISDWLKIKDMLMPEGNRHLPGIATDSVSFVTRIHNGSYEQAGEIIQKLKAILDQDKIDHFIEIIK